MSAERTWRMPGSAIAVLALLAVAWTSYFAVLAPAAPALTGVGAGVGVAAFLLGIRHGFDADHIAAIDNVTRRLTSIGRASASVGLWFALGHSTIVFAGAVLLGAGARFVLGDDTGFAAFTSVWGPAFSGLFLLTISALNARTLMRMRRARAASPDSVPERIAPGRFTRSIGRITRPWHMYPTGMLFGLGFDTATSVALLVTASFAASTDPVVLVGSVICLPLLFASGMTLVDTGDSALMARAYAWSRRRPESMLRYDTIVTGATLLVGVSIGLIQLTSAAGAAAGPGIPLFAAVDALDSTVLGAVAIACVLIAATAGWLLTNRRVPSSEGSRT